MLSHTYTHVMSCHPHVATHDLALGQCISSSIHPSPPMWRIITYDQYYTHPQILSNYHNIKIIYASIPVTKGSEESPSPSLLVAKTVTLIIADESQMERGKLTAYSHTSVPQAEFVLLDKPELKYVV